MARKNKSDEAQEELIPTPEPPRKRKPRALPAPPAGAAPMVAAGPAAPAVVPGSPENMLLEAIKQGLPVETMERLMAMRRELRDEQAKSEYFAAMAGFQGDCPVINKNRAVYEKNSTTKVRYRYATIDEIVEQTKIVRSKWGLSHTLKTEQTATDVTAICTVYHTSGWSETTQFKVPIDAAAYMSAPQKVASALTFAKRYSFCNAYGIVTGDEDDDGQTVNFEVLNDEDPKGEKSGSDEPEAVSVAELYRITEETIKKLPIQKSGPLLATALRLRDQGNSGGALRALYESALRMVAKEAEKEGAR